MTTVAVQVPEELYQRVASVARISNREVDHVVAEALDAALPKLLEEMADHGRVRALPNGEVVAEANLMLPEVQARRFSELLDRQRDGICTANEQLELSMLTRLYQFISIRRAIANGEAVRRGLMLPPEP